MSLRDPLPAEPVQAGLPVPPPPAVARPTVLYDAPGPVARRRSLIASVVAGVLLAGIAAAAVRRLAAQGQFAPEKWSPLFDPRDPQFPVLWRFLAGGLGQTLLAATLAIVISLVVGTALALLRLAVPRPVERLLTVVVELSRAVPVVVAIFFAARVLPEVGLALDAMAFVVIGLVFYNSVVIAEVLRAGLAAVPRGQTDAALALGLSPGQAHRIVVLPQAIRIMLPALISQVAVIVKDTSFGFIVAFEELLRRGNLAVQSLHNPIQLYCVIALIYIAVNTTLGGLAGRAQRAGARFGG